MIAKMALKKRLLKYNVNEMGHGKLKKVKEGYVTNIFTH